MLSSMVKEHHTKQSLRKESQESKRKDACAAASDLTQALVDHLNVGVAQAYLNQKRLDAEAKQLYVSATNFSKQTQQWLLLVETFSSALKELGDVENWAKTIEDTMPGPPPPPPPGGPPPPMMPSSTGLSSMVGKSSPDNRGALLQSIRTGTKLKKTVTVDKSAPLISANVSKNSNNNDSSTTNTRIGGSGVSSSGGPQNGIVLGGLFAGGMPKLKPTGRLGIISNSSGSDSNNSSSNNVQKKFDIGNHTQRNVNSIQSELKKQMASDSKNRGPPPPAPIRTFTITDDSSHSNKNGSTLHHNSSAPQMNPNSQFKMNSSTLHKKTNSNVNLSASIDSVDTTQNNNNFPVKPNHGKPNLAPKPPALNGKPMAPPNRLLIKSISRAHSMKSPRISSPDSPDNKVNLSYASNIGTVRNLSSVISNTLAQSTGNLTQRQRVPLNGRPSAPPPSIPLQQAPPPPPSKMIKPVHAPPPPPQHAPPPPPSRTALTQPSRPPPAVPNAPPPPPRHSSIRDTALKKNISLDLETKFANMFHAVQDFPRPMMYKNVTKIYNSKQVVNKQQAPLPPNHVQNNNNNNNRMMWDSTSS